MNLYLPQILRTLLALLLIGGLLAQSSVIIEKKPTHEHGKSDKQLVPQETDEATPETEQPPEPELQNPKMIEEILSARDPGQSRGDRLISYLLVGTLSGVTFGALASLSEYDSNANNDKVLGRYAGIFGAAGAGMGILFTYIDARPGNKKQNPSWGRLALDYTWYGAFTGALVGGLAGAVPYSESEDQDDLIRYVGFGSMAGLAAGILFFAFEIPDNIKPYIRSSGLHTGLGVTYNF